MENNNQTVQFKTNINCSSCVAKVKPFLDGVEDVCEWNVDTTNREKILTVKTDGDHQAEVMEAVQKAGFKIEVVNN